MATRPLFVPEDCGVGVREESIKFQWFPGMAASQKKKSINALHDSANAIGYKKVLEISSKSDEELGVQLSAFNLMITTKKKNKKFSVEAAFQASKVFEKGGPYKDIFNKNSLDAKRDIRLKESGNLVAFKFFDNEFPIIPRTYFYDWIYINALIQNDLLAESVFEYDAFSDIEFNPKKSINCQAHAVALYISLKKNNVLGRSLSSPESFLSFCESHYSEQRRNVGVQNKIL